MCVCLRETLCVFKRGRETMSVCLRVCVCARGRESVRVFKRDSLCV